jgi:molecular chaperone GrpE
MEKESKEEVSKEQSTQDSDYLLQVQRLQAEFINYRTRVEKEKTELKESSKEKILLKFLEVRDNFERAPKLDHGMEMIYNQFLKIFESEQIKEVDHSVFDPNVHEAIATDNNTKKDEIKEVLLKGYLRKDRVLRPAQVVVGTNGEEEK